MLCGQKKHTCEKIRLFFFIETVSIHTHTCLVPVTKKQHRTKYFIITVSYLIFSSMVLFYFFIYFSSVRDIPVNVCLGWFFAKKNI